ncbi:MAG TPA: hypothetical protein VFP72_03245 [Kineosporiaceae bacterium]|nr:hypothetical protein [Kineosporiaceae bacterium]
MTAMVRHRTVPVVACLAVAGVILAGPLPSAAAAASGSAGTVPRASTTPPMPGMDHGDGTGMDGMPGMDHGDGTGMDGMPGMDHQHSVSETSAGSPPRALVLGGFGLVNGLVLVAAAASRPKQSRIRTRRTVS